MTYAHQLLGRLGRPETRRNLGSWRLVTVIEQPFCESGIISDCVRHDDYTTAYYLY